MTEEHEEISLNRLNRLRQQNFARASRLSEIGASGLLTGPMFAARLELLVDAVLGRTVEGDEGHDRLLFEYMFEERVVGLIEDAEESAQKIAEAQMKQARDQAMAPPGEKKTAGGLYVPG